MQSSRKPDDQFPDPSLPTTEGGVGKLVPVVNTGEGVGSDGEERVKVGEKG